MLARLFPVFGLWLSNIAMVALVPLVAVGDKLCPESSANSIMVAVGMGPLWATRSVVHRVIV
jgi:hypothetical protein